MISKVGLLKPLGLALQPQGVRTWPDRCRGGLHAPDAENRGELTVTAVIL